MAKKRYLKESIKFGEQELIVETGKVAKQADGPLLLRVRIGPENVKTGYFLEDPVVLGHSFVQFLERHR